MESINHKSQGKMKILKNHQEKGHLTLNRWVAIIPVILLTTYSCNNKKINDRFEKLANGKENPCGIIINYPKNLTIFPPEISAPEFLWRDTMISSAKWHICILTHDGKKLFTKIVKTSNWRPDSLIWQTIKTSSIQEPLLFTIVGESKRPFNKKYSSGKIYFSTSRDSVDASVFYREVPLPFSYAVKNVVKIEWYIGNIEGGKPRKILDNLPVCGNCHSFPKDASILAMDVDYANDKGSYVIAPIKDTTILTIDKIMTWSDYRREDGEFTFGLLSQISPDGKYVLSTVKDRSVFVPVDNNLTYSQLFFPIKGIIAVYDRETKKIYELPGACNKEYVQSNPNWSPDGTKVIFARSKRYYSSKIEKFTGIMLKPEEVEEFLSKKKNFKFDLYRLDFNKGKGGEAKPIPGASNNNKSNYFARYSPDGKWIVFCQAENFMLLQKDSKLYIMPAEGGKPRLMNCNMDNMNSWHSWSPNGKWLVFSSKNKGPYTQLYLTHIDENGNDSPPVFLENLSFNKKAANIPEFFAHGKNKLSKIVDGFSISAFYYTSRAKEFIIRKDYKTALAILYLAIKLDSTYFDAYYNRIQVNEALGQTGSKNDLSDKKIALHLIKKQLQQKPNDETLLNEIVELRFKSGDYNGALKDGMKLIEKNPKNYKVFTIISEIYRNTKQYQDAIPFYEKMLNTYPDDKDAIYQSALCYQEIKKFDKALNLLNRLISNYPKESEYYIARANLFDMKGDAIAAKSDYDKAVLLDSKELQCL